MLTPSLSILSQNDVCINFKIYLRTHCLRNHIKIAAEIQYETKTWIVALLHTAFLLRLTGLGLG